MTIDTDYILGTDDEEVARLELQHRVWRSRAMTAWRRAGIRAGHRVLDIGCGPGYATLDIAKIVGCSGQVMAVDRSRRFLNVLETALQERRLRQVVTCQLNIDEDELPPFTATAAWCRWVFSFVKHPRQLLTRIASTLEPRATIVLHEYFDYRAWRLAPRCPEIEEFVAAVMESWRDNGGDPDPGVNLPAWLEELGFQIKVLQPIVDIARPSDPLWQWLKAFIGTGPRRLADLGYLAPSRVAAIAEAVALAELWPGTGMITPGVVEIIAVRA